MKNYSPNFKGLYIVLLFFYGLLGFGQTTTPFTSSGSWTVPAGVTSVTVEVWGAGGGGGGSNSDDNGGSGGGSGAYVSRIVAVTPGSNIPFTIGTGGAGGAAAAGTGGNGGNSTITIGGSTLTANGGTGGEGNEGTAGIGGAATGGTTNTNGSAGVQGGNTGGSGANAPNGGNGGSGGNGTIGGNGVTPGAGGGGGEYGNGNPKERAGGSGARGEIRFTYSLPTSYCIPSSTNTSDYISNFSTTGGVTNISNASGGFSTGGYGNFYTSHFVSQFAGSLISFSETFNGGNHGFNIWVDWNNNGTFETSEKVFASAATASAHTGSFTVPAGQTAGDYRMRIRGWWGSNNPDPCTSISFGEAEDYKLTVLSLTPCTGTPVAGTVITTPVSGGPSSVYTVSASGMTVGAGLVYQWQSNTNNAGWVNAGTSSSTYSNYNATAPGTIGASVQWRLVVTCTDSGLSATSSTSTFTVVSTLNVPTTGSNTVTCGTNITLYDNGGPSGNYANSSSGYTVLEAGLGATININGNYDTESGWDYVRIYSGVGTGGTLLGEYSGLGTINYTGTAGQTLTIQFYSDFGTNDVGFNLSVTYSGVCFPVCSGTPIGGTAVTTNPNSNWPGSIYTVSATGMTLATGMTYQWQYSTDAGATWTNAGAATSSYANYTATAPAAGDVHWQLVVTCTNSGQSANSATGIFVTMAVSGVTTGCPNVVSGGLGLNGADPAPFDCTASATCVELEATYLDLGNTTDYIVEPIAYNPPFAFNGLLNPVSVNTDDVWSPIVPLPFKFCFYGNTYEQCLIGSNGVITFDLVNNSPGGSCEWSMYDTTAANLPVSGHEALIENSIFGVFHDINPTSAGNVGWELITLATGCRALVVSWSNVPMYSNDTANDYTGMMVLYENSNIIEVYVQKKRITTHPGYGTEPMWNDGNAVIGIQNANGTLASVPPGRNALDPNWSATNEAWRFVPNGTSIASIAWYEGATASGPVLGTNDILNVCPTATTTYTAEITYTLCDGRTIKETDTTTVTVNGAKTWNGSVNTDWNVANNWTPSGVPTATDCVVIADTANDPIVSGTNYNGLGLNLTIQNNALLTVASDNAVTITDWVNINTSGDLHLNNSASLIQINNDVNQGIMRMDRTTYIRKLDYVYWSSPVTFASSFSSGAISPLSPTNLIFKWTPTIGSNVNGFGNWTQAVENMAVGKGYIVRGPNTFTATAAPYTATFIGTPNNGNITAPIQRGAYDGDNYDTMVSTSQGTKVDDNWNLLGNPYPSAINAKSFLTANTNIDGQVKIWTHGNLPNATTIDPFYNDYVYNYTVNDYITYNSAGASSGPGTYNGYIPAGQGFFVSMLHGTAATNETVQFNNTMRSSTYNNSVFYRTAEENSATSEEGRIWLDIVNANGQNVRTLVAYIEGATNERDRLFDAFTDNKTDLNLYSNVENEHMIIQGRRLPFEQNDQVPMGIKVAQDGTYTITIAAVEGLFSNASQTIYIEDTQTNIIHNLRQSPYSFAATTGNHANRFVLRYTNETLGTNDLILDEASVWVFSAHHLTVKSSKNEIQSVRVFDLLGRALAHYPNANSMEVPLTTIQKNDSGLIIQVTLSNGAVVTKKTIY